MIPFAAISLWHQASHVKEDLVFYDVHLELYGGSCVYIEIVAGFSLSIITVG